MLILFCFFVIQLLHRLIILHSPQIIQKIILSFNLYKLKTLNYIMKKLFSNLLRLQYFHLLIHLRKQQGTLTCVFTATTPAGATFYTQVLKIR